MSPTSEWRNYMDMPLSRLLNSNTSDSDNVSLTFVFDVDGQSYEVTISTTAQFASMLTYDPLTNWLSFSPTSKDDLVTAFGPHAVKECPPMPTSCTNAKTGPLGINPIQYYLSTSAQVVTRDNS